MRPDTSAPPKKKRRIDLYGDPKHDPKYAINFKSNDLFGKRQEAIEYLDGLIAERHECVVM